MTSSRTLGVGRGTKSWSQKAILSQKNPAHILLTYWGGGAWLGLEPRTCAWYTCSTMEAHL